MPTRILPLSKSGFRRMLDVFGLFVLATSVAFAAAGRIQFVAGEVKILNAQQLARAANKGDALEQGDTIVTGSAGVVQVALADGGLLAVRPNTQMRIDAYVYSGKADDSNNKSFFSLAKGAFRSITGVIGQNNKQAYRVNTPTATMGIRGTDHEPAVVLPLAPGESPQSNLQAAAPGSYDRVNSGQTFIQNADGLLVIGPNQVGFAPSTGGAPVLLPSLPAFYSSAPKPDAAKKLAAPTSTSNAAATGSTNTATLGTLADAPIAPVITNTTLNTDTNAAIITAATPTSTPAPLGSGLVGAAVNMNPIANPIAGMNSISNGAGSIFLGSTAQEILLGAQKEVLRIFDPAPPSSFEFRSNTSALIDQGGATLSDGGRVDWGRWVPGYVILNGGVPIPTVGDFHYIFSADITPPALVTTPGALIGGTYTYLGGTAPTNLNGVAGIIINDSRTSLLVDFTAQNVNFNVATSINGVTLTGNAAGLIKDFIAPNIGINSMTTSPTVVKAYGQFVGPSAAGAITSFDIRSSGGTDGAVGTAVFARVPPLP